MNSEVEESTATYLVEEWKKKDPFLLDVEGFLKFLDKRIPQVLEEEERRKEFERHRTAEVLVTAHQVFPKEKAREIALCASQIMEKAYETKPTFFSGRARKSVISGLFYLLSYKHLDSPMKIMDIARSLKIGTVTITKSYRRWLREFPEMFLEFELKSIGLGISCRLAFKGKIFN